MCEMKLVYINKIEFYRLIKTYLVHYDELDIIEQGYFSYDIIHDNYINSISNTPLDSTEEQYDNDIEVINKIKDNFDIGALCDYKNNILYCTDNNFKPKNTNNNMYEEEFRNYISAKLKT